MNQSVKAKWVEALTSGDYQQTKGALTRIDRSTGDVTSCCLGVLCEVAVKNGVVMEVVDELGIREYGEAQNAYCLPEEVMEWAGLGDDPNPALGAYSAAYYNDTEKLSFGAIASLINTHL